MKKGCIFLLSAILLLSGCREEPNIVHAGGLGGIDMESEYTAEAAEIPDFSSYIDSGETIGTALTPEAGETNESIETEATQSDNTVLPEETDAVGEVTISHTTTKLPENTLSEIPQETTEETAIIQTSSQEESVTPLATEATAGTQTPSVPAASFGYNNYRALNYSEVKGVWISYIELSSILTGKSKEDFTSGIQKMYSKCAELGLNTVYVHVRSHGDAYYPSEVYPMSKYVSGTISQKADFDPLEIMVEQAHAYGLSFQAWINPLRLCSDRDISAIPEYYMIGKWYRDDYANGRYIVKVGDYWYLNPAYEETISLIASGAKEVISRYDVDGLHMDDYFYPTTDPSFDYDAFSEYGGDSLSAFRLSNCDNLVSALYSSVKNCNKSAIFGISTQGNIDNNYNYMYADVKKWCKNTGYVDYMAPQIYYGFKNSALPYETNLEQWQQLVSGTSISLIPGLAVYKIGESDQWAGTGSEEWITDTEIISRQITTAKEKANYGGVILYSYNYVFDPPAHGAEIQAEIQAAAKLF